MTENYLRYLGSWIETGSYSSFVQYLFVLTHIRTYGNKVQCHCQCNQAVDVLGVSRYIAYSKMASCGYSLRLQNADSCVISSEYPKAKHAVFVMLKGCDHL